MIDGVEIRNSLPDDLPAIEDLYRAAFPDEDLLLLVRALLAGRSDVLSLVATLDAALIAHVVFTKCSIDGHTSRTALLGPLAVAPASQKKGIGSAVLRDGFSRLKSECIGHVLLLGDPEYYRRFGSSPEANVTPPYKLPAEWQGAWQSVSLGDPTPLPPGTLHLPDLWMQKELWGP
ncbi:MAG: N-acetyltransferase [Alphaproteobacteria bacterium]|nr:N-acetyltransferase [Alphaproteobacteria bacterium]